MDRIAELAVLAAAFLVSIWLVRRHPVALLTLLVAWFAAQQLVTNISWAATGNLGWSQVLILWKEFAIAGAFAGTLPRLMREIRSLNRWVLLGAAFGILLVIYVPFVISAQPLDQTLRGMRSLAFPVVLGLVGFGNIATSRDATRFKDNVVVIAAVVAAFALIEWTLIPDAFWRSIDISGYWTEVKGMSPNTISPIGLPGNFYAYFAGPNTEIRRAVGSLGDPLSLSYFLVTPFLVSCADLLSSTGRRRFAYLGAASLMAVAIGLTVSRLPAVVAGFGLVAVTVAWAVAVGRPTFSLVRLSSAAVPGVLLAATFVGVVALTHPIAGGQLGGTSAPDGEYQDPSAQTHIDKLLDIDLAQIVVGGGPGSYGILSSAYTSAGTEITSYENVYLDVAAQVGLVGAVLLAGFLMLPVAAALRAALRRRSPWSLFAGVGVSGLGLAAAALFAPQLLVVTSVGGFWLLLGVTYRLTKTTPSADA